MAATGDSIEASLIERVLGEYRERLGLSGIAWARRLSRATMRNIKQNLFIAFVYNALGCRLRPGCSMGSSVCSSGR